MGKEVISNKQFVSLITVIAIASPILYIPKAVTSTANRDGWYVVLIAGFFGMINALVILWLEKQFPGKNLMEINRILLGRFIGGLLNFVFILYFIDLCTWVLREFTEFLLITVEPTTPFYVYVTIGMILASFTAFHGLEVFARVSEIIFPIVFGIYLLVFCLLLNQYHPENLLPVLENGVVKPLKGMLETETLFGDIMIILMITNHVRKDQNTQKYLMMSMGWSTIFICASVVASIMDFGAETTSTLTYPTFTLIQDINIANILDRIDILVVAIWILGVYVKFTSYFFGAVYGISTALQLKNYRVVILPIALAMIVITKWKVPNFIQISTIYSQNAWYFALFQIGIPSALLLLAILRKKLIKKPT
ncbi:GerAB/ArcD/ProY family transporter [Brevibacillus ginsengisoli]|uniref:GerAB/ArcD/ProY family transporter n=1 Tax=Brevibacillus ginsengisoli TaxID=363854 RepID=UPI003CECC5AD